LELNRLMAAAFDKPNQIRRRNRRRAVVAQWVVVNQSAFEHRGIQDRSHLQFRIVHQGKRRYRCGPHLQDLPQELGLAEAKARGAKLIRQPFEIDFLLLANHGQKELILAIPEKQALAVRAGDLPAQRASSTVKTAA
jgi:hypothetical protein